MKEPAISVASWYRGFSRTQLDAAKGLQAALALDIEEGSSFRVRDCMLKIGVIPLVGPKKLLRIIELSRGNDLAFLYFLMSAYYKSPALSGLQCSRYSLNEQQIMTAIAYLDLPLTLRALDRLLPEAKKRVKKATEKTSPPPSAVPKPHKDDDDLSPYFQKQPRPQEHVMRNKYVSKPPTFTARFLGEAQPEEKIANEANRWFADYKLEPQKRIIKHIVIEALDKLFDQIDNFQRLDDKEELCKYHSASKDIDRLKFLAKAHERCLQLMDPAGQRKLKTRERIIKQLERDAEHYLEEFGRKWRCHRTLVPTLKQRDCLVCRSLVATPPPLKRETMLILDRGDIGDCKVAAAMCPNEDEDDSEAEQKVQLRSKDKTPRLCAGQDECPKFVSHITRQPLSDFKGNGAMEQRGSELSGNRIAPRYLPPMAYFQAPSWNKPYAFDYCRVFEESGRRLDTQERIKAAARRALAKSSETEMAASVIAQPKPIPRLLSPCPESQELSKDKPVEAESDSFEQLPPQLRLDVRKAVSQCVNKIWQKRLATYQAPPEPPPPFHQRLSYRGRTHFDPADHVLMNHMLADAFQLLRQDRNYVLAIFPDAHKLPMLHEWIKKRYGQTYTLETDDTYKQTLRQFNNIAQLPTNVKVPNRLKFFGGDSQKQISYLDYERMLERSKAYTTKYRSHYQAIVLDHTRQCWNALQCYRNYSDNIQQVFFSYLPPRQRDV